MSEKDYKSYRFNSSSEPSDEMLDYLMSKAAQEVRKSNKEVDKAFFENLRLLSKERKSEWK
ncbi:MAG: hypothetical protein K2M31_04255 [Muribaculaceae bacterium]|nr:hypothetical protein [Muribaculaceae bacterium]